MSNTPATSTLSRQLGADAAVASVIAHLPALDEAAPAIASLSVREPEPEVSHCPPMPAPEPKVSDCPPMPASAPDAGAPRIQSLEDGSADTVNSAVSHVLEDTRKNLTLTGSAAINGTGNSGNNVITGNSANNVLDSGGGADTLVGGAGNDVLITRDVAYAEANRLLAQGGEGDDVVQAMGVYGTVQVEGGAGNDWLDFSASESFYSSGNGHIRTRSAEKAGVNIDLAWGGGYSYYSGADGATLGHTWGDEKGRLYVSGVENLRGSQQADRLLGDAGANVIDGQAGNDLLHGGAGNDTLLGGLGNDVLHGDEGNDVLDAGRGNDTLVGGAGNDVLITRDVAYAEATRIVAQGGEGDDVVQALGVYGTVQVEGGAGSDWLDFSASESFYNNGNGAVRTRSAEKAGVNIDLAWGGGYSYYVGANGTTLGRTWGDEKGRLYVTGVENLRGSQQADRLLGDAADNVIDGQAGNDLLAGGRGNDVLKGGAGSDSYLFSLGDGQDTVVDSGASGDKNQLVFQFASSQLQGVQRQGQDLLIRYGSSDSVLVAGFYNNVGVDQTSHPIAGLQFSDGVSLDVAALLRMATPPGNPGDGGVVPQSGGPAPASIASLLITGSEDSVYVFGQSDLQAISRESGINLLSHISVNRMPADGVLQVQDNTVWRAVSVGERIEARDIRSGKLRFVPDSNESGAAAYNLPGLGNMKSLYAELELTVAGISPGINEERLTLQVAINPEIDNAQTIAGSVERVGSVPALGAGVWARYTFNVSGDIRDTDGSERSRIEVSPANGQTQFAILQGGAYTLVSPDAQGKVWLEPGQQLMVREYNLGGVPGSALQYKLVGQEVTVGGDVLLSKDLSARLTLQAKADPVAGNPWLASGAEDTPYVFGEQDLAGLGNGLGLGQQQTTAIVIKSLPADGVVQLNANGNWQAVGLNQRISAADIKAGKLRFVPDANETGSAAYNSAGLGNMKNVYAELKVGVEGESLNSFGGDNTLRMAIAPVIDNTQTITGSVDRVGSVAALGAGGWARYTFSVSGNIGDTDGSERSRIEVSPANGQTQFAVLHNGVYTNVSPDASGKIWLQPGQQLMVREYNLGGVPGSALQYKLVGQEVNAGGQVLLGKDLSAQLNLQAKADPISPTAWLATGTEDTPYVFGSKDLAGLSGGSTGLQSTSALVIKSLPADGVMQYHSNGGWQAVSVNQRISAADIQAGKLRFVPDANESGSAAYKVAGVGNMKNVYAELKVGLVGDGIDSFGGDTTLRMAINPVIDSTQTMGVFGVAPAQMDKVAYGRFFSRFYTSFQGTLGDTDGSERTLYQVSGLSRNLVYKTFDAATPTVFTHVAPDANGHIWLKEGQHLLVEAVTISREIVNGMMRNIAQASFEYRVLAQEISPTGEVLLTKEVKGWTLAQSRTSVTPLVLDLDGNGVSMVSHADGVDFDFYGDGETVRLGWTEGNDGLLVWDRNGDGRINNGTELFGEAMVKQDGTLARDGFDALSDIDSNLDGVFDAQDTLFDQVQVWVDANRDGVTDAGELHSLAQLGIASLDLNAEASDRVENGNLYGLVSRFTRTDGSQAELVDVWLHNGGAVNDPSTQAHLVI